MSDGHKTVVLVPDPEVTPKAKRRGFSPSYKKKILAEVDAAAGTGSIGEFCGGKGCILLR